MPHCMFTMCSCFCSKHNVRCSSISANQTVSCHQLQSLQTEADVSWQAPYFPLNPAVIIQGAAPSSTPCHKWTILSVMVVKRHPVFAELVDFVLWRQQRAQTCILQLLSAIHAFHHIQTKTWLCQTYIAHPQKQNCSFVSQSKMLHDATLCCMSGTL